VTTRQVVTLASQPPRFSTPPLPARERDGNEWEFGDCWLYCERRGLPVLWVGAAQNDGAAAPMYACASCLQRLTDRIHAHFRKRDKRPTCHAS
jgi:hypothetical protein